LFFSSITTVFRETDPISNPRKIREEDDLSGIALEAIECGIDYVKNVSF
jgi:hypothetical protein